ncbi:VWA domain-containing protein [bacterium]|nr:VWA domain-containing protein [bacterium]
MTLKKILLPWMLIVLFTASCFADSIRISQVDSSSLLLNQNIKLYISATDDSGEPLTELEQSDFKIFESINQKLFKTVPEITGFRSGVNYTDGVNFLLLIDNSESMYWTLEGKKTEIEADRRITIARQAVKSFLSSMKNPNDNVGIALYNSYFTLLSKPSNELKTVITSLDSIKRPTGDAIYSEIYGSVKLAVKEFDLFKGRKAIIILSDGVNNPSYSHTNKINQQFGAKNVSYQESIQELQLEGISLYVVYFGMKSDKKDRHLKTIAEQSGGMTFDAYNQNQLNRVYPQIMDQIQKEYIITYKATMEPADRKYVKVDYSDGSQKRSVTRYYISSSVFGNPIKGFNPLQLILVLLAICLLWLLSRMRFEKQRKKPSIEVLNAGAGKLSTQVLTLGGEQTVIGSSPSADMTIAGLPAVEENHATVVFNPKDNTYALKGSGKMMVNNQVVSTKVLEPGDLINIDGMTMIFDEGSETENNK